MPKRISGEAVVFDPSSKEVVPDGFKRGKIGIDKDQAAWGETDTRGSQPRS